MQPKRVRFSAFFSGIRWSIFTKYMKIFSETQCSFIHFNLKQGQGLEGCSSTFVLLNCPPGYNESNWHLLFNLQIESSQQKLSDMNQSHTQNLVVRMVWSKSCQTIQLVSCLEDPWIFVHSFEHNNLLFVISSWMASLSLVNKQWIGFPARKAWRYNAEKCWARAAFGESKDNHQTTGAVNFCCLALLDGNYKEQNTSIKTALISGADPRFCSWRDAGHTQPREGATIRIKQRKHFMFGICKIGVQSMVMRGWAPHPPTPCTPPLHPPLNPTFVRSTEWSPWKNQTGHR